jgi:hypothetical protein
MLCGDTSVNKTPDRFHGPEEPLTSAPDAA